MNTKPTIKTFEDKSIIWSNTFEHFKAKVYVPSNDLPGEIINYGYDAPYLIVFEEHEHDFDGAKAYADATGLADIAIEYDSSVVFVYPTADGGWDNADEELYKELIANSKIHEYHENGYAILNNRFTGKCDGYAIRGAIFRVDLFGTGKAADYIATKLIKNIRGEGLWGPAVITPTVCTLCNLNVTPVIERTDMPIVSIGNSDSVNEYLHTKAESVYEESVSATSSGTNSIGLTTDFSSAYRQFIRRFIRWGWEGELQYAPDFEELGMIREPAVITVKTSEDNCGDYRDTAEHPLGYLAYYNKGIFDNGPVPLVMCFHGGGDSAMHIAQVSGWYKVAHDHNFLLVCTENHLNSTATESMELLEHLLGKYNIDKTAIYSTGFSMGGCKTWDLYQEYPETFAGMAPMDATFDVGFNLYGQKLSKEYNQDITVPVFYAGGEATPLPELPFQEQKCLDRMAYVLRVNKCTSDYNVSLSDKDNWANPIWGIDGNRVEKIYDESRQSTLTIQYFDSAPGQCYSAFASISDQGHECRYHTCEYAWRFISRFRRMPDGTLKVLQ